MHISQAMVSASDKNIQIKKKNKQNKGFSR